MIDPNKIAFVDSPLKRPTYAAITLTLLALLFLLALSQIIPQFTQAPAEVLRVLLTALLVTSALSLIPVMILRFLDRREREAWWVMALAFFWGGVIATGLSMPINTRILTDIAHALEGSPALIEMLGPRAALIVGAPIAGPLVEETIKALGVLILFTLLRGEFDNMRDGFIYGALVGAGFTWFETSMYLTSGYAQCGEVPWGLQLGSRFALFGLASHALYTGIFGMLLGLSRQTTARWLRAPLPLLGLLLAITAHMIHNVLPLLMRIGSAEPTIENLCPEAQSFLESFVSFSIMDLFLFAPALLLILVGLWRSGIWERRVIREELQDEDAAIITAEETQRTIHDHVFGTRRIPGLSRRQMQSLIRAQNELAFRKRRVRQTGIDPDQDTIVHYWRDVIRRLRTRSAGTENTPSQPAQKL